ncbi:helix-turn-helix transcriptional regulator [Chelativorans sp. AA-79]|uniref:helix-turn-helix domain-containing protein n=1 Tax=Chelativorans sp. AA-79 TaxID=3028735 RepID=UPI0023F8B75A|nr:helix-turn-helix transcriptional regulator [Chelativorans sp. AA-79]WEX10325.1 helix-turn-helix transcriptional regulator [Chelativorans sp. AA-79]
MTNPVRIHADKEPVRIHFIPEWAEHRNMRKADVAREIGADKGLVTRWFQGKLPSDAYLEKLAALFGTTVDGLFRHPDEDWLTQFFRDRNEEERERARRILETAFPRKKTGT